MKKIRYIGKHQPQRVSEIKDEIAAQLVKQGECEYADGEDKHRDSGTERSKILPKKAKRQEAESAQRNSA